MTLRKILKNKFLLMVLFLIFSLTAEAKDFWPPQIGQKYPETEFIDQTGQKFKVSDFKGKVVLIEYVGMNCPACQAFSGANTRLGPFENNSVQPDLQSIEEYFPRYSGGMSLSDERIIFVQILLYDMTLGAPKANDAVLWAKHFKFDRNKNRIVSVATKDLRSDASYNLIPGFQLIDKKLILRSDSTGHNPRESLWKTLLPLVPKLLKE